MKDNLSNILMSSMKYYEGSYASKLVILLCLTLLLIRPNIVLSQALSIAEIIKYKKMDNDELNDILVTKGWIYLGNKDESISWAYKKSEERAQAYFSKYGSSSAEYRFCNIKGIGSIKEQLLNNGYIKTKSATYKTMITSEYINNEYEITITYFTNSANLNYTDCDSYSVILRDGKSFEEREKERREEERLRLLKEKVEKECEKSILKREERDRYFKNKVDSCNQLLDTIINSYYHSRGLAVMGEQMSEEQRQDSIVAAQRMADSLASMEAAMMPMDYLIKPSPLPNKFGVTSKSIYVYSNPSRESKIKSCLYKNETVRIIDTLDDYYEIHFDYCSYDHYLNYTGYVKITELNLIQKQPIKSNPKAKKKPANK